MNLCKLTKCFNPCTYNFKTLIIIILSLSPLIKGCKKTSYPPRAENEIYLLYKTFSPQQLVIKKGGEVIFTNRDNANHTVTSNSGIFKSGKLQTDKSFRYTFDEPGKYYFYCNYHSSNLQEGGVITVTE